MNRCILWVLAVNLLFLTPNALSAKDEVWDSETILDGFDTAGPIFSDEPSLSSSRDRVIDIYMRSEALSSIWLNGPKTDYFEEEAFRPANLKLSFDLNLSASYKEWTFFSDIDVSHDFAAEINNNGYSHAYSSDSEKNIELKEAWAQKRLTSNADLKIGRQIIGWGVSTSLRLTDVLNPLDNRWTGLTDIEDRRLPVAMTRLDLFSETTNLMVTAIHEVRENKIPVYGSPFYMDSTDAHQLPSTLDNTQWGISLGHHFRGVDTQIHFAGFFDHVPYYDTAANTPGVYPFVKMAGISATAAISNFLFKGETAFFTGKKYTGALSSEKNQWDTLVGMEYSGFQDTTLVFELLCRHIVDYESEMQRYGYQENEWQSLFKIEKKALNDTLVFSALGSFGGKKLEQGGFVRFKARYDYTDHTAFETGFVCYGGGENKYYDTISNNDIFFLKMIFDIGSG